MSSTDPCMSVWEFIYPTQKPTLTLSPVLCLLTQSIISVLLCAIQRTITSANGRKWTYQCFVMSDGLWVRLTITPKRQRVKMIDIEMQRIDDEEVKKDGAKEIQENRKEKGSCFLALLHWSVEVWCYEPWQIVECALQRAMSLCYLCWKGERFWLTVGEC